MIQDGVSKYSPRWVADQIRMAEAEAYAWAAALLERARWVHLFNLFVFLLFATFTFYFRRIAGEFDIEVGVNNLVLISRYTMLLSVIFMLVALGTLAYYVKRESLGILDILAFGIALLSLYFFKTPFFKEGPWPLTINILVELAVFMLFYFLRRTYHSSWLKWDFVIAAYIVMILLNFTDSLLQAQASMVFDTPRMLFIFGLLAAEYQVRQKGPQREEFSYIFSSMNLITPIPVEQKYRERTDEWSVRLRGLADVIIGLFCILVAREVKLEWMDFPIDITTGTLLTYGFNNYMYYFLGSYAWVAIPIGMGRWYGMKLPDYFDLPLLACSPSDRWRRWNTYYYNWFYKILFFPIFKKTRSLALATFAVFVGTLMMHAGRFNYGIFLGDTPLLRTRTFLLILVFFAIHAGLIYLGIKFPRLWPSEKSRWGWTGVALMALLMSLVHIIAPR